MRIRLVAERNQDYTPVEQILVNRGVLFEDIPQYINTDDSVVQDPFSLNNIQLAADTLIKHLESGSKILIVVDCDADGFTSAAELSNYLYANFDNDILNITFQIHGDKFHGVEKVDDIIRDKYNLVIVPDAGSNQYEEHYRLQQEGIDIIILDHHECDKESACAIVVNNQLSPNYINKGLCGAGVVFQFLRVLDLSTSPIHKKQKSAIKFVDLAALGLIADMSDMKDLETKRLIELGIESLSAPVEDFSHPDRNRFISGMVAKNAYSIGPIITAISLAFYVAPFINAVVRVGAMDEKELTFFAMLDKNADLPRPSTKRGHKAGDTETYVEQALRVLTNVKNRQAKTRDATFEELETTITKDSLASNPIIVLDTKGGLDKNLNGLVANQIMAKYARPVFVIAEKEGVISGSARNYECEQMPDLRTFVEESGFANYATGHGNAFGISFTKENLQKFLNYAKEKLIYTNTEPEYAVDFIFNGDDDVSSEVLAIGNLKPIWGKGMTEPYVMFKNVKITPKNKFLYTPDKNPTFKINSNGISFMKFRFDKALYETFAPNPNTYTLVNIVGKCELNIYNGKTYPQVKIVDFEVLGNFPYF